MIDALPAFLQPAATAVADYFSDPAHAIPLAIAVIVQLAATNDLKTFVPRNWQPAVRDRAIEIGSVPICIICYVGPRTAWDGLIGGGATWQAAHFDFWVALAVGIAVPYLYKLLPKPIRDRFSAATKMKMKGVRTAAGVIEERPAEEPSRPGEETVIGAYDRTKLPDREN